MTIQKSLVYIFTIFSFSLLVGATNLTAQERYISFEMGESGTEVTFKMTAAEIAAEDRAQARMTAVRSALQNKAEVWVERVELAESGESLEFPMTEDQINLARSERLDKRAQDLEYAAAYAKAPCVEKEVFEMADGHTIEFQSETETEENTGYAWTADRFQDKTC